MTARPTTLPRDCSGAASEHPNMRVDHDPELGLAGPPAQRRDRPGPRRVRLLLRPRRRVLSRRRWSGCTTSGGANDADIVYGKVVRTGRPTPYWPLARRTIGRRGPRGGPPRDQPRPCTSSFAASSSLEHGMRFPEGKVRLEDHNFMGQALPRARTRLGARRLPVLPLDPPQGRVQQLRQRGLAGDRTGATSAEALDVFAAGSGRGPAPGLGPRHRDRPGLLALRTGGLPRAVPRNASRPSSRRSDR